jgi:MFS family permease
MLTALSLRLINTYALLFCSHVLSGLSTALLYSVFESWYVSEHTSRGFPAEWRARTFALGTLLNSVVAILAGILANSLVDIWGFRAPYIGSMVLVCLVAAMVISTWTENYGSHHIVSGYVLVISSFY